jgi:hypothetical protein
MEFQEEGVESGIRWHDLFDEYFEYLQLGLDQRKASVLKTFRIWDAEFFPNRSGAPGAVSTSVEETAKANALGALCADEEEPEGGDDEGAIGDVSQ